MKFVLIVGLPGSGKTFLGKDLVEGSQQARFFDDPSSYDFLREISSEELVVVADPFFCESQERVSIEQAIKDKFPGAMIEWIFFANDPDQCYQNLLAREYNLVTGLLACLTERYDPPGEVRDVYRPPTELVSPTS